jgi:hypothetical protein
MSNQQHTIRELQVLAFIFQIQQQINQLTAVAPVATSAPAAGAAPVVFADINYLTNKKLAIFKQGCKTIDDKALTNGFAYLFRPSATATLQWAGTKTPSKLPRSSTALVNPLTSLRAMAKSTKPLSKLQVRDFSSLGSLMPSLAPSKTTQ